MPNAKRRPGQPGEPLSCGVQRSTFGVSVDRKSPRSGARGSEASGFGAWRRKRKRWLAGIEDGQATCSNMAGTAGSTSNVAATSPCWLRSRPSISCVAATRAAGHDQVDHAVEHAGADECERADDHEREQVDAERVPAAVDQPDVLREHAGQDMPTMPPTPWQGKTSSVSSSVLLDFKCTARLLTMLATSPITMLCADGDEARRRA